MLELTYGIFDLRGPRIEATMDVKLAEEVRLAAAYARRRATKYSGIGGDALPWAVIEAFDDTIRGHLERDPRIEDERDRVLTSAVSLAE